MFARCFRITAVAVVLMAAGLPVSAQSGAYGSYTPYSIFGVGDLAQPGSAYNNTMGGVGIASRNHRYLNFLNPAAVTARDSLSFMVDFSVYEDNKVFTQGEMKAASNTMNINDCAISFPIWKSMAMMVGIRPYSSVGYGYGYIYNDPKLTGITGDITYSASGQGSLYQIFAAVGASPLKDLSVGVEAVHYFGSISRKNYETFSDPSFNGALNGYNLQLKATTAKFGVQYEKKLGKSNTLCVGATYRLDANMRGFVEGFEFLSGSAASDTLSYGIDSLAKHPGKVKIAGELGVGVAFCHADRWRAEFDYTRSDWRNSGMDSVGGFAGNSSPVSGFSAFGAAVSQTFRAGFEIVPNRNDIRYYYKKMAYKAGAYHRTEYYKLDGRTVSATGLTFGATLPVFRWYNGLTVGVDMGQRGTVKDNLIRERYINFSFGVNLFDIWFQKPRYD